MTQRPFGGPWTEEKLKILSRYLDAYTTALKDTPFKLIYVDAFAGSGAWRSEDEYMPDDYDDFLELHKGSAKIALEIGDKPFDRLVFIEKDTDRSRSLNELRIEHPSREIDVWNGDANQELPRFCHSMGSYDRAVVFLDPFATQVEWNTIRAIAETQKIDCWILFPLMAVARIMPVGIEPSPALANRLDIIFGGREHWEDFYAPSPQLSLFGDESVERSSGSDKIAYRYRSRLENVFEQVATARRTFLNSKNSPIFELFFAAGNRTGAPIAIRIADHILSHL